MGFRQENDHRHNTFMRVSRQALVDLEMPLRTMEKDAWTYLLAHGDCYFTRWTIDNLSKSQLSTLLRLITSYGGNYGDILKQRIENKLKAD